jgi:hypothetical protein
VTTVIESVYERTTRYVGIVRVDDDAAADLVRELHERLKGEPVAGRRRNQHVAESLPDDVSPQSEIRLSKHAPDDVQITRSDIRLDVVQQVERLHPFAPDPFLNGAVGIVNDVGDAFRRRCRT